MKQRLLLGAAPPVESNEQSKNIIEILLGDFIAGATPLPIPNRAVKPRRADGTAMVTWWESKTSPS